MQAFGRAAIDAFGEVINSAAALEQTSVQFNVLIGSAEEAQRVLMEVAQFAATTPFTNPEVEAAARQLLTFGTEVDDLLPRIQNLGDIAAISGTPIASLATIFGQVNAAGRLTGERLLQLEERGVGVRRVLAEELGIAVSEVADRISAGSVTADIFGRALNRLSAEGGAAAGGIQQLSATFNGAIATFESGSEETRRAIGQRLLPFLTTGIQQVNAFFASGGESTQRFALQIGIAFGQISLEIIDFVQNVAENINPIINTFRAIYNASLVLVSGLRTGFASILAIIVNTVQQTVDRTLVLLTALNQRFDRLVPDSLITGLQAASDTLRDFSEVTTSVAAEAVDSTSQRLDDLGNSFTNLIPQSAIDNTQARLAILRMEFSTLTEDLEGELLAQGEDRTMADTQEVMRDRQKKMMLVAAQISHNQQLLAIQQGQQAQIEAIEQEGSIRDIEQMGLNNQTAILAVQDHQNTIVELSRRAALNSANAESDANRRQLARARANAMANVAIERNRAMAQMRIKALEGRADEGFASARDSLIATGLSVAKQGTAEYKLLAIAQASINAYAGASRAFVDYPYPASAAVAAAAVVAGLAQVHQITSVGGFQRGGIIPGTSFSGDRLTANVNSGELILNRAQQNNVASQLEVNDQINNALSGIQSLLSRPTVLMNADGVAFAEIAREGIRDGVDIMN